MWKEVSGSGPITACIYLLLGGGGENGRKRGRGFDRLLCEAMACAVGDDGIAGRAGGWLATQCGASRCASADLPNAAFCFPSSQERERVCVCDDNC